MSSAILYLAIVAIWACVLIPRWLRRDSAREVPAPAPARVVPSHSAEDEDGSVDAADVDAADVDDVDVEDVDEVVAPARVAKPLSSEESRRRMLAARRRLLLMLIGLEIAATSLAVLRLAAIWVVAPPSIMLTGYLLLLREAAKADAERAGYEGEGAVRDRERAEARTARARRTAPVRGASTEGAAEAAALAARFAAAPVRADYEDSGPGRDFAPGLAGKYTTSNADAGPAEPAESAAEDYEDYEAYDPRRLRAVGD